MASNLISTITIRLKLTKPFLHRGSSSFLTVNTPLCKPSQLAPTKRFLCTRDTKPNSGGRQGGVKYRTKHGQGELSAIRPKIALPKSVFSAGTAKKTAEMMRRRRAALISDDEEKKPKKRAAKVEAPDRPLSVAEWRELKESFNYPQRFEDLMMIELLRSGAELHITKSLLTFVAMETGTVSYKMLLSYLKICVSEGHDAEVYDVYKIMQGSFSSLETGATTLFIKSFCRTARLREALSLLDKVKKVFTPSSRNYGDVIQAAVLEGDLTTAWALYNELMEKGLSPHPETWDILFKGVRETDKVEAEAISQFEHHKRLLEILLYMRNNQIYPNFSLANSIKTWFESLPGQKWKGSWTSASKGFCKCCGSKLESIQLTAEEYQQLKERVITDVIEGKDVFNKTTPKELELFKEFIKSKPAFDVVVDGLNVANINRTKKKSDVLLAVVSELHRRGLTVLVLGRKHMLNPSISFERDNMNLIQNKAHCFFTDNISEDDPFLLYAALHSGNHCRFVSRDLMRDHKACLPDRTIRRLFFKWQRGHQLVVDIGIEAARRVRFQNILSYDTIIQTSGDSWHLPFDNTEDRSTYEVPQHWLCLTQKH